MAACEILLLDDDSSLFRTLAWVLEHKGYRVASVSTPEAAIESLVTKNYDLLVAKLTGDPQNGLDVVKRALKLNPETRVILVGGDNQVAFPLEAYRLKIDDYILLPCTPAALWRRVANCLISQEGKRPEVDPQVRLAAINERALNKLAIMFHDIRGSMVSTAAALKLIIRGTHGDMEAEVARKIQEIHSRVEKLVGVSEEYMAQVLSGNGDVTLGSELLDLKKEIVEPVLEEFFEEIQDHRITIDNRLDTLAGTTIPIKGSKLYLKSAFRNLMSNGIKHGGDGCTIIIDLEEEGAKSCMKVFNSGQPISEENQPLVFSSSRRPRKGDQSRDRGLGLGLRLVKEIINEQGGDICCEALSNGSNFVITLPHC
jgi:signal transduction histidine kinase